MCPRPGCDTELTVRWDEREGYEYECPTCGFCETESERARNLGGGLHLYCDQPADEEVMV